MLGFFQSTFQLLSKGGIVMIPLLLFSLLALAFTIERFFYLRRSRVLSEELRRMLHEMLAENRISDAITLCRVNRSNLSRIFFAGLAKAEQGQEEVQKAMEAAGRSENTSLSKHIHIISTVAAVSPLLGLLGTVIGMIKTFSVIQMQGLSNTENLAGGISEALISTAAGLSIAIPYFIAARYYTAKVASLMTQMEEEAERVIEQLDTIRNQPQKK